MSAISFRRLLATARLTCTDLAQCAPTLPLITLVWLQCGRFVADPRIHGKPNARTQPRELSVAIPALDPQVCSNANEQETSTPRRKRCLLRRSGEPASHPNRSRS